MAGERVPSTGQAAKRLGISVRTIYRWEAVGRLVPTARLCRAGSAGSRRGILMPCCGYPTAEEKRAAEASRGRKAGAAASRFVAKDGGEPTARRVRGAAVGEGSPETVAANVRWSRGCPCGLMPLRLAPEGAGQSGGAGCWSRVSAQSGLPREARDDSQWPVDPTRAYGVGSSPGMWEGTRGDRRKPDWGGTNDGCRGLSRKSGSS